MNQPQNGSAYTVSEVGEKLNLSDPVVRRAARSGKLRAFRVGREWRFPRRPIDKLLEQHPE